ncbi:MAG: phosphomannomutase/phosphoglucomutase [Candidatus Magasanikbacteria bacterium]|nr:phosphomannomutase/phosphoglucomutase [Candidatus Magasanikbacteria bacterium]
MSFPSHIFKAYDIRGLVDSELSPEFFYRLGRASIAYTNARRVYVGYDMRPSSVPLTAALIRGLTDQGAHVTNIGLISTPMLNIMTIRDPEAELGIMVTASHNPQEYNGCKFVYKKTMMPIGLDSGLGQIRDLMQGYQFAETEKGNVLQTDVKKDYVDFIFSLVDTSQIKPLKIVIDMGNGIEGVLIDEIIGRLPVAATYLFKEPDGRFPNHEANPLKHDTLKDLQREIVSSGANLGFAYDGDADRVGLVDERGDIIPGDLILSLLVPPLLERYPGSSVCYDVRSSWTVGETVEAYGGRPLECRAGRTLIIENMRKEEAALGGELSCHFYYRDLYGFESGDLTLLYILRTLSLSGKKLSELVAPLRRYVHSGETNFEIEDKAAAMARVEAAFKAGAKSVSHLDGVKLVFNDWWVNVRPSNTESLLRVCLEAKTRALMEEKVAAVRNVILEK